MGIGSRVEEINVIFNWVEAECEWEERKIVEQAISGVCVVGGRLEFPATIETAIDPLSVTVNDVTSSRRLVAVTRGFCL